MKNLFVLSFRYTDDPANLIGGDASFVQQFIESLPQNETYKVIIVGLLYKGAAAWTKIAGHEVIRIPVLDSQSVNLLELHQRPEIEIVKMGMQFGEKAFEYVSQIAKPGDVCLLNDFFENGSLQKLKARGLFIAQVCHILPSEYLFQEYMKDLFSGENKEMKKRFPRHLYACIKLYAKALNTHEATVRFLRFLIEKKLFYIIPQLLRMPFEKEYDSMHLSDQVIVPTTAMRDKILACYQITPDKIKVIPWGVQKVLPREAVKSEMSHIIDEFELLNDKIVLTTLSRISPEKGIEYLLEALLVIENKYPEIAQKLVLFVCGRPTLSRGEIYYQELKLQAQKLKTVKVHFPGFVSGARKSAYLYLTDIYIFASKYESFGLTLLEAMMHESAVISSDTDGARDVVKDEFGVMISYQDTNLRVENIVNAILKLSECDLQNLGNRAAGESEKYLWSHISRRILDSLAL